MSDTEQLMAELRESVEKGVARTASLREQINAQMRQDLARVPDDQFMRFVLEWCDLASSMGFAVEQMQVSQVAVMENLRVLLLAVTERNAD